ncbi:MAG: sugar phosphate isomerase/epimerase [Trueperaceae bacterium]|nr:sugar phosphate isomerase/epimerase [Trueperaceae bacterium]
MKPIFSVSEFTTWNLSFEEDVALYLHLGIKAMEVCERKLSPDREKSKEQLAYLKGTGLKVSSVQPRVHALFPDSMSPEPDSPDMRAEAYKNSIDLFSEFFPGAPLVAISGNAPDYNYRLAYETALRLYPELADYAASRAMRIMFEPLHPILMNNDSFIGTLQAGLELIDAVNRENFGLMLDVWHVFHEPGIEERIAALKGRIFGVHICDWSKAWPRCVADRAIPGQGMIQFPALLAAIEASGYDGAYCLELFSAEHLPDSLWRQDPEHVIEQSKTYFYKAWEARHA